MRIEQRIDEKHHILAQILQSKVDPRTAQLEALIVKTGNGQPIDLDKEPVILFRGRDRLALPMLRYYRQLCIDDGCTPYQLESIDKMIAAFELFASSSPAMKQPGSTMGK